MNDEIEIDLRKVILTIASGWKWIVGTALVAGVIALAVSLLLPAQYEAHAIVAVTNPRYIANFDPRYQTVDPNLTANKNFLDLANSDEIIQSVFNEWKDPQKDQMRLDDFRSKVARASNGSDPSIINLSITTNDPKESARLANYWAGVFTKRANDVYGGDDPTQLDFFSSQLTDASKALDTASQNLVDFQKRNDIAPLNNQLNSLLTSQSDTLQKQRTIRQAQEDGKSLLNQISNLPQDLKVSAAVQLNWTILSARFYTSSPSSTNDRPPVQLQIPSVTTGETFSVGDLSQEIQKWISALDDQFQSAQDSLKGIESQITTLQGQIQVLDNEHTRLTQERDLASETYVTLSHKTDELRISLQQQTGDVRIAAQAIQPEKADSKNAVRNTGIAVAAGLILAVIGVLIHGWWKTQVAQAGEKP